MLNDGVIALNEAPAGDTATMIVTGVGRSGTSMAAAVLNAIGIPMGDSWAEALHEDNDLGFALTYFHDEMRRRLTAERDAHQPKWGFKFPSLFNHLHPPEIEQFRNPRLIVVTRDTTAICRRVMLSDPDRRYAPAVINHICQQQAAMMQFAMLVTCPVLLVSYEKAVASPYTFLTRLGIFTGIAIPTSVYLDAANVIKANNESYIRQFHPEPVSA